MLDRFIRHSLKQVDIPPGAIQPNRRASQYSVMFYVSPLQSGMMLNRILFIDGNYCLIIIQMQFDHNRSYIISNSKCSTCQ